MPTRPPDRRRARTDDTAPVGFHDRPDEAELWFLPGPVDGLTEGDDPVPHPPPGQQERVIVDDWTRAQATLARRLAQVAARLGALDDRLGRAPDGWRQRLALTDACNLSWFVGDRMSEDRLAQWLLARLGGGQPDPGALMRAGWAFRRLSGGPGPMSDLKGFLDRQPMTTTGVHDTAAERDAWLALVASAEPLHPVARAALGFHHWPTDTPARPGDQIEAAVVAARLAAAECRGGLAAVPLAMGRGAALARGQDTEDRLRHWLDGIEAASLAAMRQLDAVEAWTTRAHAATAALSGRTPARLIEALAAWPMLSAPIAEKLTRASRAAVQRNMNWMQANGLIHEVTGQGRFRFWRAAL